jgi:hypothetical protein
MNPVLLPQALIMDDETDTEDEAEGEVHALPSIGPASPELHTQQRTAVLQRLEGDDHPFLSGLKVLTPLYLGSKHPRTCWHDGHMKLLSHTRQWMEAWHDAQAIDGHVEQLAGGVAGLLGGFVGRARSAGTQVAGQVEAGLEVGALKDTRVLSNPRQKLRLPCLQTTTLPQRQQAGCVTLDV